jgi:UDP-N-acetylmuramoyl-L-alanyl-D-glutamate--2,6-diaminopimelate ligase
MWQDIKNIYHLLQSIFANLYYNFPSKEMVVIGVTGTDGKTTTSSMIYSVLREAGLKSALISTVSAIIDGKIYDTGFHVTTPASFELQSYIQKARQAGVKYLVLETTSIGLHQNRAFGIDFDIGVLTNITNEHLDYHRTYERYVKAKAILLQSAKIAVINSDDKSFNLVSGLLRNKKVVTYGITKKSDINPFNFPFKSKLIGEFNKYNSLAAIAVAQQLNIKSSIIAKALSSFELPVGREEIVYDKDFKVIIDFAHTPGSFLAVLPEIKKMKKTSSSHASKKSRLIHVFGCAGLRDKYKRPEMGKISAQYSDIIVLTSEDPRSEKIETIIQEIENGIDKTGFNKKNLFKIPDRQKAISKAIQLAKPGDIVLTTGKSHEPSMNYGNGEVPWSEHQAVEEALKQNHDFKSK